MADNLTALFKPYEAVTRFNEPLAQHTSFGVGGPAQVFVSPADIDQLKEIYLLCRENSLPVFILGNGTNLLVRDEGVKGVVLKPALNSLNMSGSNIEVDAGHSLAQLLLKCLEKGLGGLEGLAGIPGSVGGAVAMNAGGKYGNIGPYVTSIMGLNRFGEETIFDKSRITFGYRTSSLKGKTVIISVNLRLDKGNPEELKKKFQEVLKEKSLSQPLAERSAGCAFKNPANESAGAVIDRAGLKGYAIGGAKVSEKHANFIVNAGAATAKDILALMNHVQETVKTKLGVTLEPEVEIW